MKIFDMHIHAHNTDVTPDKLLADMGKAGVYGGCIFSNPPKEYSGKESPFEDRINEVINWTKGYEDRLFPVVWIHPYEENVIENIHRAVERGICGFKIICADFYVYEDKCIEVLKEIAKLDKPVFFHSGILWDGKISSNYNRPLNWEALINIEGLRFSMGHCSWPWVDECLALYGKYMSSLSKKNTAEMYFDTTPGTPEIYRKELLTKLFTVGYDIGNNIMFGTDASAENYNYTWTKNWLEIDGKIMDELGISRENREKWYYKNFMRFIGKSEEEATKLTLAVGETCDWSPENPKVKEIIEKWYKLLGFPKEYDDEFYDALKNIKISDNITAETYNSFDSDGKRNLLSVLFMCEELEEKYKEKGISKDVLMNTLSDIPIWTNTFSDLKGTLHLGEWCWIKRHMSFKLFRLGRLQFVMNTAETDIPEVNVKKGDNVIEVYIPEGEPLTEQECKKSFAEAKAFFEKYFPDFIYKCFTCRSWILDDGLAQMLPTESNIIKFQGLFKTVSKEKSDAILRYTFKWNTNRQTLKNHVPASSFAEKIKNHIMSGGDFYEILGVADIEKI